MKFQLRKSPHGTEVHIYKKFLGLFWVYEYTTYSVDAAMLVIQNLKWRKDIVV